MESSEAIEAGAMPGRRRMILGIALLAMSFPPYFVMLAIVSNSNEAEKYLWAIMLLWGLSNLIWIAGIALIGPQAYRALKAKLHRKGAK